MKKTVPFVVLPLPVMKSVIGPFLGIGSRLANAFPYLELELEQAEIDATAKEYAAIMVFSFVLYFVVFSLLASFVLGKFVTAKQELFGLGVPQFALLGVTLGLLAAFLVFVQISMYPKIVIKKKIRDIESNLVYALRTMLVQMKSGVSLFDALSLVASEEKYGRLGAEIWEAVEEMNTGASEEAALQRIATKNPSPYLRKVVWQLINGMKAGADISDVLNESVESMEREQEIEIQRYGSSLRVLSLIYLMIGVIIPALGLTLLIVLGSFPKIEISELTFWALLGLVVLAEFMFLGLIKSKRPTILSV